MSFWTSNPRESSANVTESLASSPSGGRVKMWLLGILLALVPIGYGVHCLQTGHARLFGDRRFGTMHGRTRTEVDNADGRDGALRDSDAAAFGEAVNRLRV